MEAEQDRARVLQVPVVSEEFPAEVAAVAEEEISRLQELAGRAERAEQDL